MHHGNIAFNEYDRFFLSLLDGEKTAEQVGEKIAERIRANSDFRNILQQQGKDTDALLDSLEENIQQSLFFYALNGFLEQ